MDKELREFEFGSSQECWEGINEYFLFNERDILRRGGNIYGSGAYSYENYITIRKAWIDPNLDFHKLFSYKGQKWKTLLSNYIDMNYLDLVKSEVLSRDNEKATNYNISYIFANSHVSGKGCLLNATFIKRKGNLRPFITATLRSSEVVKRLPLDLLLLQRLGEYVYGDDVDLGLRLYLPQMYTAAESSTMYNIHKPIEGLMKNKNINPLEHPFLIKVIEILHKYQTIDQSTIKYKIHLRAAKSLQRTDAKFKLLARELTLNG